MFELINDEQYKKLLPQVTGRAFLFFGQEDYLKSAAVRATREAICPDAGMAFFNDVTIDAADYTPDKLLDAMAAPPMMTDGKLIVLRGMDINTMKQTELDTLLEVLTTLEEYDYNTVILHVTAGLFDEGHLPKKPSNVLKKMQKFLTPVWFDTPSDAKLVRWVGRHFAHHGVAISSEDAARLVTLTGGSMFVLVNEIEKLVAYVKESGRSVADAADVAAVASVTAVPDAFALSNALLAGKGEDALSALAVMRFERVDPVLVLGEISRVFAQMQAAKVLTEAGRNIKEVADALGGMHEYKAGLLVRAASGISKARLARAVMLAAEADAQIKNSYNDYSLLEKLISAL